jgi:ADP-ribose pyrophosphatase YjhB (NUDIX family)
VSGVQAGPRLVHAADAVIFDESDRVLLIRRADDGRWSLPCGHSEPGESPKATVRRETREETGLEVIVEKAVGTYRQPHPADSGDSVHLIASVFVCRVVGGDLRPGHETTDVAYFNPAALPENVVPTHVERITDALAVRRGTDSPVG